MSKNDIDVKSLIKPIDDEYAIYLRDESRSVGEAQSISFPKSEQEVVAIVKECAAQNMQITVQGGRTGISAGAVPHGGHVLNLSRMTSVHGIRQDPEGLFCIRVGPGLVLTTLRDMLENKKLEGVFEDTISFDTHQKFMDAPEQFFTTDPTETTATFGGIAACNASGARSFLYGPARKYITALRVVLSDGQTLALERGKVRAVSRLMTLHTEQGSAIKVPIPSYDMPNTKNASGYYAQDDLDAVDLFVGSDGTLGIITEVEFKVFPLPAVIWGLSCFPDNEQQVVEMVELLRSRIDQLAAIEYIDSEALEILRNQKASGSFTHLPELSEDLKTCLYCELHCKDEDEAETRISLILDILSELGIDDSTTWMTSTTIERTRMAELRHAIPESVNMLIDQRKKKDPAITKLGSDMSVPRDHGNLRQVLKLYRDSLAKSGLHCAVWGHIGDNHLHVNVLPNNTSEYAVGKEMFVEWAKIITKQGGAVSAEHGAGKLKAGFLAIMYGEESVRQMKATKAALDPKNLLGVGNLF